MKDVISRFAVLGVLASASLAVSLLAFGTGKLTLSDAATSAAKNSPNLAALPLGDGKTTTTSPQPGYLFQCSVQSGGGGAAVDGPWINTGAGTYDLKGKFIVDGDNPWPNASFKTKVKKAVLKLVGNGLPTNHGTGNFPVAAGDDAYQVDRNPNVVTAQSIFEKLRAKPKRAASPGCTGGTLGIARNGVPIFNAVDGTNRDAVAHEVQDACAGHPQNSGQYHYHGLPACLSFGSVSKHSKLIGWALDGFPIYGPIGNKGRYMRISDLDACHGHTHKITYQGTQQKLFHYHATDEFPYTVGCYRGTAPIQRPGGGGGAPPAGGQPPAP